MTVGRLLAAMVALLMGASPVMAHPAGLSESRLMMRSDGAYDLTLSTDAEALPVVLALATGRPVPIGLPAEGRPAFLTAQAARLAALVRLVIDGQRADLRLVSIDESPASDDPARAIVTVRLAGSAAAQARIVTFSTDLLLGAHHFVVTREGGSGESDVWIQGPATSPAVRLDIAPTESFAARAFAAVGIGFTHILPYGIDHVLFVVGLCLLSARLRDLLWQVSAFTISHSATFVLAATGHLAVPPAVVEPVIALSIAYVAFENLTARRLRTGRIALVTVFGLLHGMGFAGALAELGLPPQGLAATLAGFNVGVELGQIAVVGLTVAVLRCAGRLCASTIWVTTPASIGIGLTGVYWAIERLA